MALTPMVDCHEAGTLSAGRLHFSPARRADDITQKRYELLTERNTRA